MTTPDQNETAKTQTVDQLMVNPQIQQDIRDFFTEVDQARAERDNHGYTTNTVEGRPLPLQGTLVTSNGLLLEVSSQEKKSGAESTLPEQASEGDAAVNAFERLRGFDTTVVGDMLDLNKPDAGRITLTTVGHQSARRALDIQGALINGGITMLFGHVEGAEIQSFEQASEVIGRHPDPAAALKALADEGAYVLGIKFQKHPFADGKEGVFAYTSNIQCEYFSVARKRNGFQL